MTTITLGNVPADEQLHAMDILNAFRNISAGLAITFSDIGWDHYTALVKNHLTSPNNINLVESYVHLNLTETAAQHLVHIKVATHSGLLTLNTMFYTLTLIFSVLGVLIWWVSPKHIVHKTTLLDDLVESMGEEA